MKKPKSEREKIKETTKKTTLKRSEEDPKLEAQLLDAATDSILLLDVEGNLIYINEAAYKSRGYTKDELMAMNLKDFNIPEHKKFVELRMQEVMEKGEATFESAHFRKDGSIMQIEVHARVIEVGDKKLVLGVTRDITDRKQAEESLRKEKTFSDTLINSLPGIFYLFDENGHFMRWNRNLEIVSGYSSEEIEKMNPLDFFSGEDKKLGGEAIQEVFVKGESNVEANLVSKDRRRIPYYFTGLRFISHNMPYLVGMGIDITERKRAEDAQKLEKAYFEQLFESAPEAIAVGDVEGRIVHVNAEFNRLFAYTQEEASGRLIDEFSP